MKKQLLRLFNAEIKPEEVNLALLVFRITVAGMMLTHGFPKFQRLLSGNLRFGDPLGLGSEVSLVLAVIAEFLGSIMIILGLGTRIAALLIGFTMAVAGLVVHADDPFNTKEKAFLYLSLIHI